jgi:hypothetical protein
LYYLFNNDWWSLTWTNSFLFYNCKTPCGYKPFEVSFLEKLFSTRVTRLVLLSWKKNSPAKDSDSLFCIRANQSLSYWRVCSSKCKFDSAYLTPKWPELTALEMITLTINLQPMGWIEYRGKYTILQMTFSLKFKWIIDRLISNKRVVHFEKFWLDM